MRRAGRRAKAKPANWTDTVVLVNMPQGWKVDDVVYDADFAFGNTGRLSEMLTMVIASNPVTFRALHVLGMERKRHDDTRTERKLTPEQHHVTAASMAPSARAPAP